MKKIKIQMRFSRKEEVHRMLGRLEKDSFPRFQMTLLVFITGGFAFLTSFLLLHAGITSMWERFLITCIIAYGIFLLLIWVWLRSRFEDYSEIADISNLPQIDLQLPLPDFQGSGGDFGGGGASASFDSTSSLSMGVSGESENPIVEAIGAAGEAEELALPLIVLILIITVVFSAVFIIQSAPILFAELLVDSLLVAGLYQKTKGEQAQDWYTTAFKRTIIPFLITTVVSVLGGYLIQYFAPAAKTLGDVLKLILA